MPPIDSSKPHESDNVIDSIVDKYKERPSIELKSIYLNQTLLHLEKLPNMTLLK